jgi:hypothetical protein
VAKRSKDKQWTTRARGNDFLFTWVLKHLNTVIGLAYPIFLANRISILIFFNLKGGNFTAI